MEPPPCPGDKQGTWGQGDGGAAGGRGGDRGVLMLWASSEWEDTGAVTSLGCPVPLSPRWAVLSPVVTSLGCPVPCHLTGLSCPLLSLLWAVLSPVVTSLDCPVPCHLTVLVLSPCHLAGLSCPLLSPRWAVVSPCHLTGLSCLLLSLLWAVLSLDVTSLGCPVHCPLLSCPLSPLWVVLSLVTSLGCPVACHPSVPPPFTP